MIREYTELTKPRITILILICTAVGYYFAGSGNFEVLRFVHALIGTGLMASGTAALNQWYERDVDSKMRRTRGRPLPSRRIEPRHAFIFAMVLSMAGFAELWFGANALAAALGLLTEIIYLCLYTPMKLRSPVCTTIGAVPGALPPVIGYAAASGQVSSVAVALFAILFLWQFPHFYAIAWMYREDYASGGIKMLPVVKPDGHATAYRIVVCSIGLIPVSLIPQLLGMAGALYALMAIILGLALTYFGVCVARARTIAAARNVLLASVVYLPLLLIVMMVDGF